MRFNAWTFLRSCLALAWLTTTVYVAIPDYPYGTPIWVWTTMDPNGFLHEEFYIAGMFVLLITLTYYWQRMSQVKVLLKTAVRRIEKDL